MNNIKKLYADNRLLFNKISEEFKLPIHCILAVLQVESNDDDGFNNETGKLIIRFEAHKFLKFCTPTEKIVMAPRFSFNNDKPWKEQKFMFDRVNGDLLESFHGNQHKEHIVLNTCQRINPIAAYKAISMGLAQIMGFHYHRLGFTSPSAMFDYFSISTENQIIAMFDFMTNKMIKALRLYDYVGFARGYNGSGNAQVYGDLIGNAVVDIKEWISL